MCIGYVRTGAKSHAVLAADTEQNLASSSAVAVVTFSYLRTGAKSHAVLADTAQNLASSSAAAAAVTKSLQLNHRRL